jgi:hypothetical protein
MMLIAGADDTECFSRRMKRILAQRIGNAKPVGGGFRCKTFLQSDAAVKTASHRNCDDGSLIACGRLRKEIPSDEVGAFGRFDRNDRFACDTQTRMTQHHDARVLRDAA